MVLVLCTGASCSKRGGGGAAASASVAVPSRVASATAVHDDHTLPHSPPRPAPSGPPPSALSSDEKTRVTVLRVAAHKGAVIIRKRDGRWILSGPRGCEVPPERVARALDNLANLAATKTGEPSPDASAIELQIVAQIGQAHALHLELAGSDERGTLVRLPDDSTRRIRGLDRKLWRPDAGAWCAKP